MIAQHEDRVTAYGCLCYGFAAFFEDVDAGACFGSGFDECLVACFGCGYAWVWFALEGFVQDECPCLLFCADVV